jgi:hypothetical protein
MTQPISMKDVADLLNIVNLASTRGAFRANELSSVGAIYDKVAAALAPNEPPQDDEQTEKTE